MDQARIKYLIDRHSSKLLTESEQDELLEMLTQPEQEEVEKVIASQFNEHFAANATQENILRLDIFNAIVDAAKHPAEIADFKVAETDKAAQSSKIFSIQFRRNWWVAAAVLLMLFSGALYWYNGHRDNEAAIARQPLNTIEPGKDGAILTLADGTQIVLDSIGNGLVAEQNGVVVEMKNGELTYFAKGTVDGKALFNTMSTPKGRQFMVVLPDGSRVWLNSSSSLKYPVVFDTRERVVVVSGEAYFEVTKKAGVPFRVNVDNKAQVEVLGTHFNINAYDDEQLIKTTLLEGAVSVQAGATFPDHHTTKKVTLKPGQQAQLLQTGISQGSDDIRVLDHVDLDNVMAWKNGVFNFEGMHLKEVLKQLERWYDIEIEYEDGVKDVEFYGELRRNNSLNDVIAAFNDVDVHFKIDGRKLIVLKN